MYYELYLDSLFLINFVMNLYLLILVDHSFLCTATRRRLVLGAATGAIIELAPFLWDTFVWLKFMVCTVVGIGLMLRITFKPKTIRAVCSLLERMLLYYFLMGGLLLFLNGCLPVIREWMMSIWGIMGVGALGFLFLSYVQEKRKAGNRRSMCNATLVRGQSRVTVRALIDSGNSLIEPVSGKPVSVIDGELYRSLWPDGETLYRVVPYHSIGKKGGILKGFLLPQLLLEIDGMVKEFRDVYVAVSEEQTGEQGMILNPRLLDGCRKT